MKKLIFTSILLIILCAAWMLYLNYSHKRFIDDIGMPPVSSTKSTNTPDTPTVPDEGETIQVDVTPSESVVENVATTDKQTKVGLKAKHPQKATVEEVIELFEKQLTEADGPEATKTKNAFEDFLESQGISREEYERQTIALETLQRLINNPVRWLDGNPNMIFLTDDELDELFEMNDSSFSIKQETPMRRESILPKDAIGIKQNEDGSWSFV